VARFRALPLGVFAPDVRRPVFFTPFRAGPPPLRAAACRPPPAFFPDGLFDRFAAFARLPFALAIWVVLST
jgi:hypothetical protein